MAIAFDAVSAKSSSAWVNSTGATWAHTCGSGSNRYLLVFIQHINSNSDIVTGVTYGGVSMTRLTSAIVNTSHRMYIYGLAAPIVGTSNIIVSESSGQANQFFGALSYTGVASAGQPDSTNTQLSTSTNTTTVSTTVVASNCWLMAYVQNSSADTTTYTNCSNRLTNSGMGGSLVDSNGIVGTGSQSVSETGTFAGSTWESIIVSIAPASTSAIKTVNGLAIASVKKINGLAIASVKTWNGLA